MTPAQRHKEQQQAVIGVESDEVMMEIQTVR